MDDYGVAGKVKLIDDAVITNSVPHIRSVQESLQSGGVDGFSANRSNTSKTCRTTDAESLRRSFSTDGFSKILNRGMGVGQAFLHFIK